MGGSGGRGNAGREAKRYSSSRYVCEKSFLTALLLSSAGASLILASSAFALGDPAVVPYVESSEVVMDGVIGDEEYAGSYVNPTTGMSVYWEHDGENIYLGMVSKGTGWVAIGFGPENTGMDGANIVIGAVDDASGVLAILDEIGVGFEHYPDTDQGGSDDILGKAGSQNGGTTVIEFVFPLDSGDVHDHAFQVGGTYGFILAYQKSVDDMAEYHTDHSTPLTLWIEDPEAAPPQEPGAEEPGQQVQPKSTSLSLSLPAEAMANGELYLSAKLIDEDGAAVENSVVDFYVNTTFGEVKVGSAVTDKDGVAIMNIIRKIDGTLAVRAEYAGGSHAGKGSHIGSSEVGYITVSGAHVVESDPLYWVFNVTQGIIAIVMGSVFSVFAYVLYQVGRISRSSSTNRKNVEGGAS
ncbi:MAG: DOMON domain-containing protein [Nitrososphaerales archaeon]